MSIASGDGPGAQTLWDESGRPAGWANGSGQRYTIQREQGRITTMRDAGDSFSADLTFRWEQDEHSETPLWFHPDDQGILGDMHRLHAWPMTFAVGGGVGKVTVELEECDPRRGCTQGSFQLEYDVQGRLVTFDWSRRGSRTKGVVSYEEGRLSEIVTEDLSRSGTTQSRSTARFGYGPERRLQKYSWVTVDASGDTMTIHEATVSGSLGAARTVDYSFASGGVVKSQSKVVHAPCVRDD